MEALLVSRLPEGHEWRYEPKWDGFRCLAYKRKTSVTLHSKSGKPLDRYFPDIVRVLAKLKADNFVLDGELLIKGEEGYSFTDLQMRLHPAASRVSMLAKKQPATFVLFDILEAETDSAVMSAPFAARRLRLESFYARYCAKEPALQLSPQTASIAEAMAWLKSTGWALSPNTPWPRMSRASVSCRNISRFAQRTASWEDSGMAQVQRRSDHFFWDCMIRTGA